MFSLKIHLYDEDSSIWLKMYKLFGDGDYKGKKGWFKVEDYKFAELDQEQLQEVHELEEKLGVTLIAYNAYFNDSSINPDHSATI